MTQEFDVVVIGAGPGGYVAAIRSAQLGLKTAIIEKKYWGGVCLNIGCIPSKALLETTELLEQSRHSFAERGLIAGEVKVDMPQMMAHKDGVVAQLDGGIQGLLKKHKIDRHFGHGRLLGGGKVEVQRSPAFDKSRASTIRVRREGLDWLFPIRHSQLKLVAVANQFRGVHAFDLCRQS